MGLFDFNLEDATPRSEQRVVKVPIRPVHHRPFRNSSALQRELRENGEVSLFLGKEDQCLYRKEDSALSQRSPLPDISVNSTVREQVMLVKVDDKQIAKLAKPVWPKSYPTIPSTFFKGHFQTEVALFIS